MKRLNSINPNKGRYCDWCGDRMKGMFVFGDRMVFCSIECSFKYKADTDPFFKEGRA